MKFRSDFVTNSSSSSFIVCFEEKPSMGQIVDKILGPKLSLVDAVADYEDGDEVSLADIACRIAKDISLAEELPLSIELLAKNHAVDNYDAYEKAADRAAVKLGFRDRREYWSRCSELSDSVREQFYNLREKYEAELLAPSLEKLYDMLAALGSKCVIIEYEDHCRLGAEIEHGGYLEKHLHAYRISNH